MQWSDLTTAIGAIFNIPITSAASATPSSNMDFNNILPRATEQAELRILREFDLITQTVSAQATLKVNVRNVTVPGSIIIVDECNVITPSGVSADQGTRNPMQRISTAMLNAICPQATVSITGALPRYYAMLSDTLALIGPAPDAAYGMEFIGPIRPQPMSASNATTWIGTNLPDLFLAAVAYFIAGYQRDYGAQSEDPKLASSWNQTYETLKTPALVEEARRKAQSVAWQPYSPTPLAEPRT